LPLRLDAATCAREANVPNCQARPRPLCQSTPRGESSEADVPDVGVHNCQLYPFGAIQSAAAQRQ
jgi:hypothetical protein